MRIEICNDIEWLLSKEAFFIYSSCMYQPTFDDYKKYESVYVKYFCEYPNGYVSRYSLLRKTNSSNTLC